MNSNMEYVRKYRKIPVKRGMSVRIRAMYNNPASTPGRLLSCPNGNCAALIDGKRYVYHPFDFDYLIDGQWRLGDDYQSRFQEIIDVTNARWAKGGGTR